ncbi:hypothetical protein GUITHDRAFT_99290 [Guillardia theta CCMP2712]|uniref:GH29D-like beta-sandwich domain-containing protein n=1 Tax=Guillardia theta (strain CCMP2712) TaxID=905079 RepID=L1K4I2_GUITC|nr:hypothetical protein GUITHDRAFT_99290 [Guillardia theta CCMP2712]EKX55514.1 hypothetical protein GUITHDRAFT_99290 [Guillardia theta CCMP2712]|eukprot:XP_005842494.1 hypothetical protein GUITHDRAFT_99290 [Guillardia theta CCMP2712]
MHAGQGAREAIGIHQLRGLTLLAHPIPSPHPFNETAASDRRKFLSAMRELDAEEVVFSSPLRVLTEMKVCELDDVSLDNITALAQDPRRLQTTADNAALVVLVVALGRTQEQRLQVQDREGRWVFARELVDSVYLMSSHKKFRVCLVMLSVFLQDSKALLCWTPATLAVEEGRREGSAMVMVWAACPVHEGWMDEKGSVVTQVVCESLCANAEIQSIEGSMQEVKEKLDWYRKSKGSASSSYSRDSRMWSMAQVGVLLRSENEREHRLEFDRVCQPSFSPRVLEDGTLAPRVPWQTFSEHELEVKVSIACPTPGAKIFFSSDGSIPSPDSPTSSLYTKPVLLQHRDDSARDFMLQAVAVEEGRRPSRVGKSPVYRILGETKSVTFEETREEDSVFLSMTCCTQNAIIYFDEDGKVPCKNSSVYSRPIREINTIAIAPNCVPSTISTYRLLEQLQVPRVRLEGETMPPSSLDPELVGQQVFLDMARVSIEGEEEKMGLVCMAMAYKMADSLLATCDFIVQNRLSSPELLPSSGTFRERTELAMTSEHKDASIFFTLDDSDPSPSSSSSHLFQRPIRLDRRDQDLFTGTGLLQGISLLPWQPLELRFTARAMAKGFIDSPASHARLVLLQVVETPRVSPSPGVFLELVEILFTSSTPGAILHYTRDGQEPSKDSQVCVGPIVLRDAGWTEFRVRAVREGMWESEELCVKFGVMAWGSGSGGRLGGGDEEDHELPSRVLGLEDINVARVFAGRSHNLLLTSSSKVLSMGVGLGGRLGRKETSSLLPKEIPAMIEIVQAAAGERHSLLLSSSGIVFSFGDGLQGQLGQGDIVNLVEPKAVEEDLVDVVFVAAGGYHSLAIERNGHATSWGRGGEGQLGSGTRYSTSRPSPMFASNEGGARQGLYGCKLKMIAAGDWHTAAAGREHSLLLDDKGKVWVCGSNERGQLGTGLDGGSSIPCILEPLRSSNIASIFAGPATSAAVDEQGAVFAWGSNSSGMLGLGDSEDRRTPCAITSLGGLQVVDLAVGAQHMLALTRWK